MIYLHPSEVNYLLAMLKTNTQLTPHNTYRNMRESPRNYIMSVAKRLEDHGIKMSDIVDILGIPAGILKR